MLGGLIAISIRPRRPLLISEGFILLFPLPIVLLAVPSTTAVIAAGAFVAGSSVSLAEVLYETTLAQNVPQEALSRVTAYDWLGSLALEPIGLALVGPLAAGIGIPTTLWLGTAVMTLCLLAVIAVPSVRRLEAVPMDPTPLPPPRPVEAGD